MIKKILVSQPKPTSEKSPYFDIEKAWGEFFVPPIHPSGRH
jgi:uroporphyrinogen-III synthase